MKYRIYIQGDTHIDAEGDSCYVDDGNVMVVKRRETVTYSEEDDDNYYTVLIVRADYWWKVENLDPDE